jgi:hypothetical protein
MYGLLDESGRVQTGRQTIASAPIADSYRISLSLPVGSGHYRLRFAVADAAGRVGSLDAPVVANLSTLGPFAASDVLLSWSSATTKPRFLALSEVPVVATTLQAFLELYPSAGQAAAADVRVRWTIVGPPGGRPGDQTVTPVVSADRLTASAQWTISTLPPGEYELDAAVQVRGQTVGTVTTTFRKASKDGLLPWEYWLSSVTPASAGRK